MDTEDGLFFVRFEKIQKHFATEQDSTQA